MGPSLAASPLASPPSRLAKWNRELSVFRRGGLPNSTLEMCSRASDGPSEPRAQLENAGVSLPVCSGYSKRQRRGSCEAGNRIRAVNYLYKPYFLLPGPGSSQPRQSVQEQKNKDCRPRRSVAGGVILGHRVPAKTCHFFFSPFGRDTGNLCESE